MTVYLQFAPGTHLARLVVMDDVIYVGMPSCEEHLKSKVSCISNRTAMAIWIYLSAKDQQQGDYTGSSRLYPQVIGLCRPYPKQGAADSQALGSMSESVPTRNHLLLCRGERTSQCQLRCEHYRLRPPWPTSLRLTRKPIRPRYNATSST